MHRKLSEILSLTFVAVIGLLALQSCIYDNLPFDDEDADSGTICVNTMLAGSRAPAPSSVDGSGESFTVLFWQREEYLITESLIESSSFWLAPYLATSAPRAVTAYSEILYDTNYPYPIPETTPLFATGYAPADVLKPDVDEGYRMLYVPGVSAGETDNLDRGRYDFLGCDAWNDVFCGSQQQPFGREVNKLIFRHLASKLLFLADRDQPSMENKQYVRFVEITNVRMSTDGGQTWTPLHTPSAFQWKLFATGESFPRAYTDAIGAAQTLNSVTSRPEAGYKTIASEQFSNTAGFMLTRRTVDGKPSVDRVPISGQRIDSCYVCNPYDGGVEVSGQAIRLKMDISAELSFDQSFPNSDRDGVDTDDVTFTRRWTDVEVDKIYSVNPDGTTGTEAIKSFRPGMEYRIYITFSRTGVNLVARELPWDYGGLHYVGIIGSDQTVSSARCAVPTSHSTLHTPHSTLPTLPL